MTENLRDDLHFYTFSFKHQEAFIDLLDHLLLDQNVLDEPTNINLELNRSNNDTIQLILGAKPVQCKCGRIHEEQRKDALTPNFW